MKEYSVITWLVAILGPIWTIVLGCAIADKWRGFHSIYFCDGGDSLPPMAGHAAPGAGPSRVLGLFARALSFVLAAPLFIMFFPTLLVDLLWKMGRQMRLNRAEPMMRPIPLSFEEQEKDTQRSRRLSSAVPAEMN